MHNHLTSVLERKKEKHRESEQVLCICVLSMPDAIGPSAGHGQSHDQASVHCLETCLHCVVLV